MPARYATAIRALENAWHFWHPRVGAAELAAAEKAAGAAEKALFASKSLDVVVGAMPRLSRSFESPGE